MTNKLNEKHFASLIETLKGAEKLTKATLSQLSRELLVAIHIQDTNQIESVNATLSALTPMNRSNAELFFKHFLPWAFDGDKRIFTKKFDAGRKTERKRSDSIEFLDNAENDIWTWVNRNIAPPEFVTPDYMGKVAKVVESALKGKLNPTTGQYEGAISTADILMGVMAGGLSGNDIINMIDLLTDDVSNDMSEPETKPAHEPTH